MRWMPRKWMALCRVVAVGVITGCGEAYRPQGWPITEQTVQSLNPTIKIRVDLFADDVIAHTWLHVTDADGKVTEYGLDRIQPWHLTRQQSIPSVSGRLVRFTGRLCRSIFMALMPVAAQGLDQEDRHQQTLTHQLGRLAFAVQ